MVTRPRSGRRRRGMAALEVVVVAALFVPIAVFLLMVGFMACRNFYHVVASLVDWTIL